METPVVRIARIAERQHSVFTRSQAMKAGLSTDEIDGRLRRGLWTREHRNVYRIGGAPQTPQACALAAVLAAGTSACVSHTTAANLWRLEGIEGRAIEVSVQDRKRTRIPGVHVHMPRTLTNKDITRIGAIPLTTPARTLIDVAGLVPESALEDSLDDAIRRGWSPRSRSSPGFGIRMEVAAVA